MIARSCSKELARFPAYTPLTVQPSSGSSIFKVRICRPRCSMGPETSAMVALRGPSNPN
jgi:hypothetical protein